MVSLQSVWSVLPGAFGLDRRTEYGAVIPVKARSLEFTLPNNSAVMNWVGRAMALVMSKEMRSIPTPRVTSEGGWVKRVSTTMAYDSELESVMSKASPFINVTSRCSSSFHRGSLMFSAFTAHWKVGRIHSSVGTPGAPGIGLSLVSIPKPSPRVVKPSRVNATDKSSVPSPSMSM